MGSDAASAAAAKVSALVAVDATWPRLAALHVLIRDVYATSDAMSEDFEDKFPSPSVLAAEIAAVTARPGGLVLVADAAPMPLGYLVVEPRPQARLRHTADLTMGVASAARGRGIGRLLVAEALTRVAAAGIVEIVYLMVRADNLRALELYRHAGFERVATLRRDTRIDGRYHDGVLMRRFVGGYD
jgi:phosphinothricin acetyltransferase